jgi:hypothetical protein
LKPADIPAFAPESLPAWISWLAQDASGAWWGYEHEPNPSDECWYENEVGRYVKLGQTAPNPAWRSTLTRRECG